MRSCSLRLTHTHKPLAISISDSLSLSVSGRKKLAVSSSKQVRRRKISALNKSILVKDECARLPK